MPSFIIASNGVPVMIDWPTIDLLPAVDRCPSASIDAPQAVDVEGPVVAAPDVVLAQSTDA